MALRIVRWHLPLAGARARATEGWAGGLVRAVQCLFASCWLTSIALHPALAGDSGVTCLLERADDTVVVSKQARVAASARLVPRLLDEQTGFAWPDTPLGVVASSHGLMFFGSDGGLHAYGARRISGGVVRTLGSLADPLGTGMIIDVAIRPNAIPRLNRQYNTYSYLGGGPVLRVPGGQPGAGSLLMVTHAEITVPDAQPEPTFYSVLGLASSRDDGVSWMALGEIIRTNRVYTPDMEGFDIGDPPLVITEDGMARVYFRDWLGIATKRAGQITTLSMAQAPLSSVFAAAFGAQPHAAPFSKFFNGGWEEPGLGGRSTDLYADGLFGDERQVIYDSVTKAFVMITSGGPVISATTSRDGMIWAPEEILRDFRDKNILTYAMPFAAEPVAAGHASGFVVFYTAYPTHGDGWHEAELRSFPILCR